MTLTQRTRASVRDASADGFNDVPLTVQPHDRITAYRINADMTVSACELVACAHGLPVKWFKRARGCDVMIDSSHADYFSSELVAYQVALRRADALHEVHIQRARRALETRNAAYDALITFEEGKHG